VRNKKRFELKVLAVLLNAFELSLRKTSGFFGVFSEASLEVEHRRVDEEGRGEAGLQPEAT